MCVRASPERAAKDSIIARRSSWWAWLRQVLLGGRALRKEKAFSVTNEDKVTEAFSVLFVSLLLMFSDLTYLKKKKTRYFGGIS